MNYNFNVELTTSETVKHIKNNTKLTTYYAITSYIRSKGYKMSPIALSRYEKGITIMSQKVRNIFYDLFGIIVIGKMPVAGRPSLWKDE